MRTPICAGFILNIPLCAFRMYVDELVDLTNAIRMRTLTCAVIAVALFSACEADHGEIVLRDDGLAVVSFGDAVEPALATLVEDLGEPSIDQLLVPPWPDTSSQGSARRDESCIGATGYKCVNYLRRVVWDRWGLAVVFSDVRGYGRDLSAHVTDPHFVVWEHWTPPAEGIFVTERGIGPGSTLGDLRTAYGGELIDMAVGCREGDAWIHEYVTSVSASSGPHITPGNDMTESEPLDASVTIQFLWAGFHKDCRPGYPYLGPQTDAIS
jgi:hypothetical protein